MTNLTIAAISFLLETNWLTTHTITPVPGFHDSTTYFLQTARVERVEYRIDTVRGREIKREVDREYMPLASTSLPPRIWPTNAPPSMLGNPFVLLRHRQDAPPIPMPPLPPQRKYLWDEEVNAALAKWADYNRTHKPVPINSAAVDQASAAYAREPNPHTAGELLALIKLFTTEPVP